MDQTTVRNATPDDAGIIADFNCRLALETEDRKLDRDLVTNGVTNGLKVGDEVRYLLAECADQVVGQLMLTREWSDWRNGWMYWLQSVYVQAGFRGQGVFRRLLQAAVADLSQRSDVVGVRLYVENENQVAQTTYQKLQFKDCGYRVMERLL